MLENFITAVSYALEANTNHRADFFKTPAPVMICLKDLSVNQRSSGPTKTCMKQAIVRFFTTFLNSSKRRIDKKMLKIKTFKFFIFYNKPCI